MVYSYFSHNGKILPVEQAVVPLSSVEYSYGFGVYETIRVTRGCLIFLGEHTQRLMHSAEAIRLIHSFSSESVQATARELIQKNQAEACNIKILLIGGPTAETANLYMLCLSPLFPDRKLYTHGAIATTQPYEREFPQAKTLNMLPSYLAYRTARAAGAYDALLINRQGCITEGTRTNFFALKGRTIVSPPEADILPGVMRQAVMQVGSQNGFKVIERAIKLDTITDYDGAFLTSTSSKIMPLKTIGNHTWQAISPELKELMVALNQYLDTQANDARRS